jgi:hypothetical protein
VNTARASGRTIASRSLSGILPDGSFYTGQSSKAVLDRQVLYRTVDRPLFFFSFEFSYSQAPSEALVSRGITRAVAGVPKPSCSARIHCAEWTWTAFESRFMPCVKMGTHWPVKSDYRKLAAKHRSYNAHVTDLLVFAAFHAD